AAENPLMLQATSLRRAIDDVVNRKTELDRRLEQLAIDKETDAWMEMYMSD
ncbi:hypothetical protein FHG87_017089, partial [Trinorchestia longiramus]